MSVFINESQRFEFLKVHRIQPVLWMNLFALEVNMFIPKSGIYIGSLPINFGYMLLCLGAFFAFCKLLLGQYALTRSEIIAFFLLFGNFAFQVTTVFYLGSKTDANAIFSHFASVLALPPLALLSAGYVLRKTSSDRLRIFLFVSLGCVCVFGIVHFLALNIFKVFLGIPFVTFTGATFDIYGKSIDRGGVFKLISTYNNGNILGVNLLMWSSLALYGFSRKKGVLGRSTFIAVLASVQLALLLTLSRTVWLLMVFTEIFLRFFVFRRLQKILSVFFVTLFLFGLVTGAARVFVQDPIGFIFDSNLGARRGQLEVMWSWLPNQPFAGTFEIVYASMLNNFGVIGLTIFFVTWAWPAFIVPKDFESRLVQMGLITYLLAMGADGAFVFVPTQATYWYLVAFALNPFKGRPELKR
jgi:hypothetical protein